MRLLPLLACLPLLLAGCLPASGPYTSAILASGSTIQPVSAAAQYDVVTLDAPMAEWLATNEVRYPSSTIGTSKAPDLRIGIGDKIVVTIFEAASGGLFSGEAGVALASKSVSLPAQPVAQNGMISMPYVGEVKAAGLTPAQLQTQIEVALMDKAIDPQVIVTIEEPASTFVTVSGDVASPSRIPLSLGGNRILDIIAAAGGTRAAAYDSLVRLTRRGSSMSMRLIEIIERPEHNIYVRPDDEIHVTTDRQSFTAFGATGDNSNIPFETDRLTLAEAIGRAGGLNDARANPSGVFLFRYEDAELHAILRGGRQEPEDLGNTIPVIYQIDLKKPGSYFAAQRFLMRDNDVIYVANAGSTSLTKFFTILNSTTGAAQTNRTFVRNLTTGN